MRVFFLGALIIGFVWVFGGKPATIKEELEEIEKRGKL